MDWLDRTISRWRAWQVHLFCLLLTAGLGAVDYYSGFEASFSVFYLMPLSTAAWYLRGGEGYVYSVLAALVWTLSNVLAGESLSHPALYWWNGAVRSGFFLIVCHLLRKLRVLLDRERQLSRRDHLTGLLNVRAFSEALTAELARAARGTAPLGLAFIDLDRFKEVNDAKGHSEGDRVLVEVARCLGANLRRSDTIARMGGDEFGIILPECTVDNVGLVGQKLLQRLRELSLMQGWPVSASIGVVVREGPSSDDRAEELIRQADNLMYRAKEQGRDSLVVDLYKAD